MRKIFSQKNLHPNISKQVLEYHKEVINEVEEAIAKNQIVIVGMDGMMLSGKLNETLEKLGKNLST